MHVPFVTISVVATGGKVFTVVCSISPVEVTTGDCSVTGDEVCTFLVVVSVVDILVVTGAVK